MEALRLYWLGRPVVELKARPIKLETRKVVALLSYLSLNPGECQRERLAAMFWPEGSQQKALANLRRILSSLNLSLPGWIEADRETIMLKDSGKLWLDVEAFHQLLSQIHEQDHSEKEVSDACLEILEKAAGIHRGEFLEGMNLVDAPRFDEWQLFQRDNLQAEVAGLLQRLSCAHAERAQWEKAIADARLWVALDRLHEPASRLLMEVYARAGQRTAALHHYDELRRLLDQQMGQEPEEETRRLQESIRGQQRPKQIPEAGQRLSSFPLLKTKLYIPAAPASRVVRSHLIGRLNELERKALTLVSAPAGFGKTTLLAEWIAQSSLPVAWLSLDSGDNDPYRFLSYLIAALESIQEGVGTEAGGLMRSLQLLPPHIILASLINDLGGIAGPYVLALDDCQFITEHTVHETITYLLDHLPSNMHLVIATRADPPVPLGRLRAHGQLLELRAGDLRFSFEEAMQLLNGVMKLGLSQRHLQALEHKTEGWVVGLQMAALSLRTREERDDFIRAFSGSDRYVMDYLLDEVLASQETYVEHFLVATSHLDRLCGPLCDAVLDQDGSGNALLSGQEMLEYLEAANMFVVPLDGKRLWYRYHHLFADLLRTRQGKFSSDQMAKFHIRASLWYEGQGLILDAIRYALDGGDYSRAAALIDGISRLSISPVDFGELQSYIDRLPAGILREHPWTCLAQTHSWVTLGTIGKVEEWLDWAEGRIPAGHQDGRADRGDELSGTVALHRAYVSLFRRDLSAAARLGSTALRRLGPSHLLLRCRLALLVGECYLLQGLFEDSDVYLRQAVDLGKTIPDMTLFTTACYRLTLQLKLQGRLTEAETIYQENIRLLKTSDLESSPLMAKPLFGLGDIYRERGQLSEAGHLLLMGTKKAEQLGHPSDLVYAYSLMARYLQARGDVEQAIEYLDKNLELFRLYPTPDAITQVTRNLRVCLCLLHRKPYTAGELISLPPFDLNTRIDFLNELDFATHARSLILSHDFASANRLLIRLADVAEQAGRVERLIKVLVLQAIALHNSGEEDRALAALTRSLVLAEPEGYQRIFLDEGEPVLMLLERLMESKDPPHLGDFVNRLLEAGASPALATI